MVATGIVYVVTCGRCGQTWQRSRIVEDQTTECIFCAHRGRLSVGAAPGPASGETKRVEAWLMG